MTHTYVAYVQYPKYLHKRKKKWRINTRHCTRFISRNDKCIVNIYRYGSHSWALSPHQYICHRNNGMTITAFLIGKRRNKQQKQNVSFTRGIGRSNTIGIRHSIFGIEPLFVIQCVRLKHHSIERLSMCAAFVYACGAHISVDSTSYLIYCLLLVRCSHAAHRNIVTHRESMCLCTFSLVHSADPKWVKNARVATTNRCFFFFILSDQRSTGFRIPSIVLNADSTLRTIQSKNG